MSVDVFISSPPVEVHIVAQSVDVSMDAATDVVLGGDGPTGDDGAPGPPGPAFDLNNRILSGGAF